MFWRWQWSVLTSVSLRHTEKHTEWNPKYTEVIHRDGVRHLFSNPSELGRRCFQVRDADWGGSRSETAWWRLWNIFASGVRQRGTTPTRRLAVQRRRSSASPQRRLMQEEAWMTNLPTVQILHSFCCCWPFWSSYRIRLPTLQPGTRAPPWGWKKDWQSLKTEMGQDHVSVITFILHVYIFFFFTPIITVM